MNPRIGAIGLGLLLFITSFYIIPDPNNYNYYPWLYWAPYSFPVIAGVLVWWLVYSYGYGRFKQTMIGIGINLKQKKEGDAIYYVYVAGWS